MEEREVYTTCNSVTVTENVNSIKGPSNVNIGATGKNN